MNDIEDFKCFKEKAASVFKEKGYKINYSFFENGDFGALNQIDFESKKIGGNVDFWGLGWLGVFVWNFETKEEVLNILLEPHQEREKYNALTQLLELL